MGWNRIGAEDGLQRMKDTQKMLLLFLLLIVFPKETQDKAPHTNVEILIYWFVGLLQDVSRLTK